MKQRLFGAILAVMTLAAQPQIARAGVLPPTPGGCGGWFEAAAEAKLTQMYLYATGQTAAAQQMQAGIDLLNSIARSCR